MTYDTCSYLKSGDLHDLHLEGQEARFELCHPCILKTCRFITPLQNSLTKSQAVTRKENRGFQSMISLLK